MPKPNYEEWSGCPVRYSMGILGDRWSFLIVRDVIFNGYSKFGDFLTNGEGISTTVLTDRLVRLEKAGVLSKSFPDGGETRPSYRLTRKGMDLLPVILQLVVWAAKYDEKTDVPETWAREIIASPDDARRSIERLVLERGSLENG